MKALKFIINGEEQEIPITGSSKKPGVCTVSLSYDSASGKNRGTVSQGKIEDGAILIMNNYRGRYSSIINIDDTDYELLYKLSETTTAIIRTNGINKIFTMQSWAELN